MLNIHSWLSDNETEWGECGNDTIDESSLIEARRGFDILKKDIETMSGQVGKMLPTNPVTLDEEGSEKLTKAVDQLSLALSYYGVFLRRLARVPIPDGQCPICWSQHEADAPH